MRDSVRYEGGRLYIRCRSEAFQIEAGLITRVDECQMADPVHHGDETFHVLHQRADFWLFGPMLEGALGAVDALLKAHPEIPRSRAVIERVPWKMRERGAIGLRLWPIVGCGRFSNAELKLLHYREVSDG